MRGSNAKQRPQMQDFKLPDFLLDNAFALRAQGIGTGISRAVSDQHYKADKAALRNRYLFLAAVALVLTVFSLCLSFDGAGIGRVDLYAPWDVLHTLFMWAAVNLTRLVGWNVFDASAPMADFAPLYLQVVPRAGMTLATLVCGALLACAGMLYQTVFRNPIASPSLLGITNGVKVGLLLMFLDFGTMAQSQVAERFFYGYTYGIITLLVVFALSKLIAKRKSGISIFDMLVIGTIMSGFLSALSKYILNMLNSVDMWTLFFEFQEGLTIYNSPVTYVVLFAAVVVSFLPVFIMRFHMNLLSFSDGEARIMGTNPRLLRVLSIISGSLMILTAQVFVGPASSFALVIPFLARGFLGSEFRAQLWGNVLIGMIVLLFCRDLSVLIPFVGVGIPIGTIAGIVTLPVFIWATLFVRKAWQ